MLADRDQRQHSALHLAVDSGSLATVELLVQTGMADVNVVNDTGDSPLHGAVVGGQLEIVKLLVRVRRRDGGRGLTIVGPGTGAGRLESLERINRTERINLHIGVKAELSILQRNNC